MWSERRKAAMDRAEALSNFDSFFLYIFFIFWHCLFVLVSGYDAPLLD